LTTAAGNSAAVLYSVSSLAVQVTVLACQIWVLRYLPPTQLGVYHSALVINGYLAITQLGVLNGMNREYPVLLGQGNSERASLVLSTAQSFALANGALQALVFVGLAFGAGDSGTWRAACFALALCAPLRQYLSYLLGLFRSNQDFRRLAHLQFAQVLLHPLLVLLPWRFGFPGFCSREVLVLLLPVIAYHLARPAKARPLFRWPAFKELFDTGWRLYLWSYLVDVGEMAPRTVLAFLGGPAMLALFVPVNWMLLGMTGISTSISSYLYPTLAYRFGKGSDATARAALRVSAMTFLLLAPFAVIGIVLLPFVFPVLLPKYAASVPAARLILLAGLFECASIATVSFSVARAWGPMARYLSLLLPIRAGCTVAGYYALTDHVAGVALGALVSSIVMVPVTWMTVRRADRPRVPQEVHA
jgi:O-antigen/teichoic acid export membrane protein